MKPIEQQAREIVEKEARSYSSEGVYDKQDIYGSLVVVTREALRHNEAEIKKLKAGIKKREDIIDTLNHLNTCNDDLCQTCVKVLGADLAAKCPASIK